MIANIADYIAVALGVMALCYLIWLAAHPDKERYRESDDRAFFDAHGRWPDEPQEAAVLPACGSYADVDVLPHQRED